MNWPIYFRSRVQRESRAGISGRKIGCDHGAHDVFTLKLANHADVLIIGAGPAGAVAALQLQRRGLSVVVLEQGTWPDRTSFPSEADWEITSHGRWSYDPGERGRYEDYPIDLASSEMGVMNFNGVGGGSVLYNAHWVRLLPHDFHVRSSDGVADDWPLTYDELRPYYEETDRQFGVSGLGGNPLYPLGSDPPLPPLPIGEGALKVARAHARLGWHWWPHPCAILSASHNGRRPCVGAGTCGYGCREGAKASVDLTHWPSFVATGGQLITDARVARIVTDRHGLAAGAEWLDHQGSMHLQSADVVLCAANGIGTPRLLLMSYTRHHPDGLANSSGLVGRRLMFHPHLRVNGLFDTPVGSWRGPSPQGAWLLCQQFASSDHSRGFLRGAKWTLTATSGPVNTGLAARPFGPGFNRFIQDRWGRSVGWNVSAEDLPNDANLVRLSSSLVDSSGLPAPALEYRVDENCERILGWNAEQAARSLMEAGAHKIEHSRLRSHGHFMGTARMGTDPATSVVDRWGFAHDVPNLGILDASVFVTAGSSNPTSTIAAIALRAADRVWDLRSRLARPEHSTSYGRPELSSASPTDVGLQELGRSAARPNPLRRLSDSTATVNWLKESKEVLSFATELIPGGDGFPSGGDVLHGSREPWRVLASCPELIGPIQGALVEMFSENGTRLRNFPFARHDCRLLVTLLVHTYFQSSEVRARYGVPDRPLQAVDARVIPAYIEEGLLDHLLGLD